MGGEWCNRETPGKTEQAQEKIQPLLVELFYYSFGTGATLFIFRKVTTILIKAYIQQTCK